MTRSEAIARCWADIDLDEIAGNYHRARAMIGTSDVICVLKGDAYGLGALPVCQALVEEGARRFAVASGAEAEALLQAHPGLEVLVLGLTGEEESARLIAQGAVFTLFSRQQGEMLRRAADSAGMPARVHIKAETGLYRLGFSGEEGAEEAAALVRDGRLRAEGLFTHLALHDAGSDQLQFERFDRFDRRLTELGVQIGFRHIDDSIGMVRYPARHCDAVRLGAWLYGVTPKGTPHPDDCRPVAALHARIAQLHRVPAGERIGYDDDHYLERDTLVATLSAGYLDGAPRLQSVGEVEIRGRRAPVLGLVCMDQMMVDATDIPGVREGDAATLLGDGITIDEFARWGHFNRNEALGRLGSRVVRVYHRGGETFVMENGRRHLL